MVAGAADTVGRDRENEHVQVIIGEAGRESFALIDPERGAEPFAVVDILCWF